MIGLSQTAIVIKLKEIEQKHKELLENPTSEIVIKYQFLQEKNQLLQEFKPFLYNN